MKRQSMDPQSKMMRSSQQTPTSPTFQTHHLTESYQPRGTLHSSTSANALISDVSPMRTKESNQLMNSQFHESMKSLLDNIEDSQESFNQPPILRQLQTASKRHSIRQIATANAAAAAGSSMTASMTMSQASKLDDRFFSSSNRSSNQGGALLGLNLGIRASIDVNFSMAQSKRYSLPGLALTKKQPSSLQSQHGQQHKQSQLSNQQSQLLLQQQYPPNSLNEQSPAAMAYYSSSEMTQFSKIQSQFGVISPKRKPMQSQQQQTTSIPETPNRIRTSIPLESSNFPRNSQSNPPPLHPTIKVSTPQFTTTTTTTGSPSRRKVSPTSTVAVTQEQTLPSHATETVNTYNYTSSPENTGNTNNQQIAQGTMELDTLMGTNTVRFDEKAAINSNGNGGWSIPTRNQFTLNDTRFEEMVKLSSTNSKLKHCLDEMRDRLDEMDEFKIALEHSAKKPINDVNEMRIDLLKAQIARQQRHIRSLTGLLKSSRKAFKEVLQVTSYFTQLFSRHKSSTNNNNQPSYSKKKQLQQEGKTNTNAATTDANQKDGTKNGTNNSNNNVNTPVAEGTVQIAQQEDTINLPESESGIIAILDAKLNHLSLKNLLSNLGQNDDRENFVGTFSSAFSKIIQFERPQKEFAKLFAISKKGRLAAEIEIEVANPKSSSGTQQQYNKKQSKVSYNAPVKEFIEKYGNHFPVNTIFSSFPSQSKETFTNMLNVLSVLLRKCDRGFKQVRTFSLFRSNPFLYIDAKNRLDIPETLVTHSADFESFMNYKNQMACFNLSHESIAKTESNLASLLNALLSMYQNSLTENKHTVNEEVSTLIQTIRSSIEALLSLGIMLNPDRVAQTINKELRLDSNHQHQQQQLIEPNENQLMNRQKTNQANLEDASAGSLNDSIATGSMRSIKVAQKRLQELKLKQEVEKIEEELRDSEKLRCLRIDKDLECTSDFFDKHSMCESVFDDLNRSLMDLGRGSGGSQQQHQHHRQAVEDSKRISRKLGLMVQQLKSSFEMKNNILLLRDLQISFLKQQLLIHKQDIAACTIFFAEVDAEITKFFTPIHAKLHAIMSLFNAIMDANKVPDPKTRKTLILNFKTGLKEVLELIKKAQDKTFPVNSIDIQNLQEQFDQQVTLATRRFEHFKNNKLIGSFNQL